jgi:N-acetyl-anhydromuramyl-L-alanine amidase AmpD
VLVDPALASLLSTEGTLAILAYGDLEDPDEDIEDVTILPPTIREGDRGDAVAQWQEIIKVEADKIFGPLTDRTTRAWQSKHGLVADGWVGPLTWRMGLGIDQPSAEPPSEEIPFTQAKYYTPVTGQPRQIDVLVIHTMEAGEYPQTAENVAYWFARGCPDASGNERRASAHYNIDEDSIVQCVHDKDVAYCAPGANHNGVHLEHAGYSHQRNDSAGWQDAYSQAMLARSAKLAASLCKRHGIPVRFIGYSELLRGEGGITYHREVSKACRHAQTNGFTTSPFYNHHSSKPKTNHGDPGRFFPIDQYLTMINNAIQRET